MSHRARLAFLATLVLTACGGNPAPPSPTAAGGHMLYVVNQSGASIAVVDESTRALAATCRVTGADISAAQIALAREHMPKATFVQADMTALPFAPASFDAVVAFYALTHVPREEHAALLGRSATWLRPGGLFFATMGASDSPGAVEPDWLGAPMFFSHYDAATNRGLVEQAGLALLDAQVVVEDEDGEPVAFLWVAARKPLDLVQFPV